jgi:GT2 family glycosyltransferase
MSPTAEDYDRSAGEQTLAAELSAAGLDTITSLQTTLSHIRPWSAVPRQPVAPDAAPLARGEAAPALLSVVIPTRSRRDQVVALVRALLDDPALLEVIVVVDGEDQPTFAALVALAASSPRLVPIQQPHGGAGAARQNGVQLAHGDVVLLLDDDVVPAPGLVSAHAAQHQAAPGRLVVGSLPPVRAPRRTVHSVVDEIYAVDYDVCYRDYVTNPHSVLEHLWAGNMSLDRNVALEVGIGDAAFDSLFFEDRDLGLRLRRAGVKAVFCPELRADHHHVGTLTGYLRDSLRQGRALVLLRRRYPDEVPEPTVRGIAGKFPWPARALVWGSHRSPDRTGRVVCGLLLGASYLAGVLRMYQLQRPLVVLLRRTAQARGAAWARQALAPC